MRGLAVTHLRNGLLHPFLLRQLLVTSLVQEVRPAEADEGHLQERVLHEQAGHDAGDRHQVVTDSQALRLAGEHPQEDIRKHSEDIPRVASDVTETVETEPGQDALPSSGVRLRRCGLLLVPGFGCGFLHRGGFFLPHFGPGCCFRFLFPFFHPFTPFLSRLHGCRGLFLFLLLRAVRIDPFLLVAGGDDLRDVHLLSLMCVHRVDDRVDREVGADELQSTHHAASESSHSREISRCSQAPADAFLHRRGVIEPFSSLLDLPLQGSLAGLLRQAEESVAPGLA